jgi:hypothetical protein
MRSREICASTGRLLAAALALPVSLSCALGARAAGQDSDRGAASLSVAVTYARIQKPGASPAVPPPTTAIVVEAAAGRVVARVPLDYGHTSAVFSPDGTRAVFYCPGFGDVPGNSSIAYEVRTSDYTLTRAIVVPGEEYVIDSLFFSPRDGSLHAVVSRWYNPTGPRTLHLVRVGEEGATAGPPQYTVRSNDMGVSPDGRLAFILRPQPAGSTDAPSTVDVLDLSTMQIRSTLTLADLTLSDFSRVAIGEKGEHLYVMTRSEELDIQVCDARTGEIVREVSTGIDADEIVDFGQGSLVGGNILVSTYVAGTIAPTRSVWAGAGAPVQASRENGYAAQAGHRRLAVDAAGTTLFELDAAHRVARSMPIRRPSPRRGSQADEAHALGLAASPDGKHAIVFVGRELEYD